MRRAMRQRETDPADREERLDRVIAEFLERVRDGPGGRPPAMAGPLPRVLRRAERLLRRPRRGRGDHGTPARPGADGRRRAGPRLARALRGARPPRPARPLRGGRPGRPGGDGGRLQGARRGAEPIRGDQGAGPAVGVRSGRAAAVHPRGAGGRGRQPPARHHDPRRRRVARPALPGHGIRHRACRSSSGSTSAARSS